MLVLSVFNAEVDRRHVGVMSCLLPLLHQLYDVRHFAKVQSTVRT